MFVNNQIIYLLKTHAPIIWLNNYKLPTKIVFMGQTLKTLVSKNNGMLAVGTDAFVMEKTYYTNWWRKNSNNIIDCTWKHIWH